MTTETTTSAATKLPRDSVIVYIPLSVTADLGVAIRRVRAKRLSQIKKLCPSLFQNEKDHDDNDDDRSGNNVNDEKLKKNDDDDDDVDDEDNDPPMNHNSTTGIRREQFGSIVEYLEAKYAKGVMIDDFDERIREKKKRKRQNKNDAATNDGGNKKGHSKTDGHDEDDMSILSESAAGSCYSNESGNFIDDSELRNEVAHQILGSSAYGKTKIEAKGAAANENNDSMLDDDDHGFFVNIGDLEMEEGWTEHDLDDDEDWMKMMAKAKGYVLTIVDCGLTI